jgi:hypothetical protein
VKLAIPSTWRALYRRIRLPLAALAGVTIFSIVQAGAVWYRLPALGLPRSSFRTLVLLELPVWGSWIAVAPVIVWVCRRFPVFPQAPARNVLAHLGFLPLVGALAIALMTAGREPFANNPDGYWLTVGQYLRAYGAVLMMNYLTIAALYYAVAHARRERQLAEAVAQARMDQLTAQIQPHFIFNSLHSVSAVMAKDVTRARSMLVKLADLLRSGMEHAGESEVPLSVELGWLDDYTSIQRMRYGERFDVGIRSSPEAGSVLVPRFLLQPLLENVVRHVVEQRTGNVRVDVDVRLADHRLEIAVTDDGPGFARLPPDQGTGLGNIASRVEAFYGNEATLSFANGPEGGASVRLVLPARPSGTTWVAPRH